MKAMFCRVFQQQAPERNPRNKWYGLARNNFFVPGFNPATAIQQPFVSRLMVAWGPDFSRPSPDSSNPGPAFVVTYIFLKKFSSIFQKVKFGAKFLMKDSESTKFSRAFSGLPVRDVRE